MNQSFSLLRAGDDQGADPDTARYMTGDSCERHPAFEQSRHGRGNYLNNFFDLFTVGAFLPRSSSE